MHRSRNIVLIAAALAIRGGPLHAQSPGSEGSWTAPGWVGDAAFLSFNTLSSGVTAGVLQKIRGKSFGDGFVRGALGGSVHYAGLRISAQRFDGAGLLGRQVSATGVSMVRNASDGVPVLERLFVPLGPLHLYIDLADGVSVRPKVNLTALTLLLSAAAESRLEWDAGASLSAGAPVFRAPGRRLISGDRAVNGFVQGGSIFIGDIPRNQVADVLAHERAHILQGDWRFLAWSDPVEAWMLKRIPLGSAVYRYFDIDLIAERARSTAYWIFDVSYANRLHEIEASFLESR